MTNLPDGAFVDFKASCSAFSNVYDPSPSVGETGATRAARLAMPLASTVDELVESDVPFDVHVVHFQSRDVLERNERQAYDALIRQFGEVGFI